MATSLQDKLSALPEKRQLAVQNRANELISQEMTLRDLRLALEKTQKDLCESLHITQDGVSRLEKRSDLLLSTLNKYIEALGGKLKITAEFPNRPTVSIHLLSDIVAY